MTLSNKPWYSTSELYVFGAFDDTKKNVVSFFMRLFVSFADWDLKVFLIFSADDEKAAHV